ncbi:hypothetical protein [Scytonema sp. NUACC26]|uniref:hypothetical protein n=1 Tax=Scytonema sp. NUACC26 TaxID=3140176 RepID=UPI0034DBDC4C
MSRQPNQPQRCVELRVTPNFAKSYLNLPLQQLVAKGVEVIELPDDEIFTLVELDKRPPPPPNECL